MSIIGLSLKGQFRFQIYNKEKKLLRDSDFINNFITKSGVFYPYHFAFADCFRFLSVGSGDRKNSIRSQDETTGLHIPLEEFSYIGSRNSFEDENNENTNYSSTPSCGYRFPKENVVELYRQWTLPSNSNNEAFEYSGEFKEFMVSPGRPYVITDDGGKLCSCDDSSGNLRGLDCSAIAEYYNWVNQQSAGSPYKENRKLRICDGDKAFARLVLNQPINFYSGDILNITYKLSVIIDSGVKFKSLRPSDPINGNWNGKLNFVSNITQPGIKLINDGSINNNQSYKIRGPQYPRLQHYNYIQYNRPYNFNYEYGESFVPPHGIPLEPSNLFLRGSYKNIISYVTEDNTQFILTPSGGPLEQEKTGGLAPWNLYFTGRTYFSGDYAYSGNSTYKYINSTPSSGKLLNNTSYWTNLGFLRVVDVSNSGLKPFKNDFEKVIKDPYNYWGYHQNNDYRGQYNIRMEGIYPSTGNVLIQDYSSFTRFSFTGIDSQEPIYNYNSRTGSVKYTFDFRNFPATDKGNLEVKSLVFSYKDIDPGVPGVNPDQNLIPFFDVLFSGTGKIFIPKIITGIQDYGNLNNTGAFISGSNDENYFYLGTISNSPYPIFNTFLNWSVPCPPEASGCS